MESINGDADNKKKSKKVFIVTNFFMLINVFMFLDFLDFKD